MKLFIKNYIKNLCSFKGCVFSITLTFSIYYLLVLGTYLQFYVGTYGIYSCDNCFTQVPSFPSIVSAMPDIPLLIVSFIIFISSTIHTDRWKIFITILITSTVTLTINDIIYNNSTKPIASYIIENILFNSLGSIFLAAFILFNLSSISHLINKNNANPFLSALIPISSSLFICLLAYGYLYLIYERSPAHIDAVFSNVIIGDIITSKDESFGFLSSFQPLNTKVQVDDMGEASFNWLSKSRNYDIKFYQFSGCILNDDSFAKNKTAPTAIYKDVKSLKFKTTQPSLYFINGKDSYIHAKNITTIQSDSFKNSGELKKGNVQVKNQYAPFTVFVNIVPFKEAGYIKNIDYTLSINGEENRVSNNISTYSIGQKKDVKCKLLSNLDNSLMKKNKVLGLPSLAIEFIPKGDLDFKDESMLEINIEDGHITKDKNKNSPLDDYSNGYLKHINSIGLESLKINNKPIPVTSDDLLYASGEKLIGFVTKDNKIKIYGDANKIALNTKTMNLKPISILNNKLTSLNTSIADITKLIFGVGVFYFIGKYLTKYFKRKNKINIL